MNVAAQQLVVPFGKSFIFIAMRKSVFFFAVQLIVVLGVHAQTGIIAGTVSGDEDKLELAAIQLLKTTYGTATDSNGYYRIIVPAGKYQLKASYVGFENFQQQIAVKENEELQLHIVLVPLASKLKEVVVTGSMKEVRKSESVTPVDVYSQKYFERNPVTNLFDGLYQINGLFADVDNGVSNTTDVQINGLEGNYTMYLIDGVPALGSLAGIYALNAFPMSIVDKVEIVKGSSSPLYGSEAIGGVINIKTKSPNTIPRFSANVMLTSMLETYADFTVAYKTGKAASMLSVSAESFNTRWDINSDNFLDIPLVNRVSVYNKWALPRADNKVANIYIRYLYEDRFGGEKNLPSKWRGSKRYYSEAITTNQWQAGLQYQLPVKENIMFQLDYTEHRQNAWYGYNRYKGIQAGGFAQVTWSKKVDNITEFVLGATYRLGYFEDNTPLSADSLTGYPRLSHLPGIFFEDELNLGKGHKMLLGARIDYSNRNSFVISPRLNYKWNSKDKNNVIRAGVGTGYRLPNVVNEGIGAMNGSRSIEVEGVLKPERTITGNLGYNRVQVLKGGLLSIEASGFYTYFFNFVEPNYNTDQTKIIYANSKGAQAAGFSINADFTFNYPLKVGVGVTYTNVYELEEEENGEIEKETPEHQPPFVANFYLSYSFPIPQLSIDWTGNFVAPMLLSTVENDYRPEKSPPYTIQNIQLTKKFRSGLEIYAGLKNIFNFIQKDPILRSFDPYNTTYNPNNPADYRFDTTYGFTTTQGIKGFVGLRYVIK
ncbi:MAG: TonB-dependent receptor [Chitinophagales bacterium]|nr:TonB-dependent receptor [Chitinophagales bacterium]